MKYRRFSTQTALRDSDVLDIRKLLAENYTETSIAQKFGIARKTVYNIAQGKTWTHVPAPKAVRGFPSYTVYPDGRVWSVASNQFMATKTRVTGERFVDLRSSGKRQSMPVSLLVARAFLNSRSSIVNYIDDDRSNAHVSNLSVGSKR